MIETAIIFIFILGLLVFVHELGHFIAARKTGMPVEEFGIGFPPRVWSFVKGETRYSLNLIPLGGFVKITGEDGQANNPDAFNHKPIWQRAIVLVAGVTMNVLLAWIVLSIGFTTGLPSIIDDTIPSAAQIRSEQVQVINVLPESPAAESGISKGDIILTVDGETVTTFDSLTAALSESGNEERTFSLMRGTENISMEILPELNESTGQYQIGVGIAETGIVSYPWYMSIKKGMEATGSMLWQIIVVFGQLLGQLFSTGSVDADVSGPLGIAVMTGQVVDLGVAYVLQFIAILSLNLAIINIIPFPALDGGKLLFLGIEAIKGSPINQRIENSIHNIGFLMLILLVIVVTYHDALRFGGDIIGVMKGLLNI